MKKLQIRMIAAAALLCMGGLTACGNDRKEQKAATENRITENNTTVVEDGRTLGEMGNSLTGETDENGNLIVRTTETDANGNRVNGAAGDGNVVSDVADSIGDAGKEVIDGAENVVDDLTGTTNGDAAGATAAAP